MIMWCLLIPSQPRLRFRPQTDSGVNSTGSKQRQRQFRRETVRSCSDTSGYRKLKQDHIGLKNTRNEENNVQIKITIDTGMQILDSIHVLGLTDLGVREFPMHCLIPRHGPSGHGELPPASLKVPWKGNSRKKSDSAEPEMLRWILRRSIALQSG